MRIPWDWFDDGPDATIVTVRKICVYLCAIAWVSVGVLMLPRLVALALPERLALLIGFSSAGIILLALAISLIAGLLSTSFFFAWVILSRRKVLAKASLLPLILLPLLIALAEAFRMGLTDPELLILW